MRIRSASLLVLMALLALVPGCTVTQWIGKNTGLTSPPKLSVMDQSPPPEFRLSIAARDVSDPPTDYTYVFNRSGKCTYDVTVRAPRRNHDEGEFEISEDQIVGMWRAVQEARFDELDARYPGSGDGPDRAQGIQTYYVFADDADWRIETWYVSVPALQKVRALALASVPDGIKKAEGNRKRPKEYIGDMTTHLFHAPDCVRLKDVPSQQRRTYVNEFDALNDKNQPCPDCTPMPKKPK